MPQRHTARRLSFLALGTLAVMTMAASCNPSTVPADGQGDDSGTEATFALTSSAFENNGAIPQRHTGDGVDVSPELSWSNAPEGTVAYALIMDDPDAPSADPWVHWVIYGIPGTTSELGEDVPQTAFVPDPAGALQGVNSWDTDNTGYRGPLPPAGDGVHHYHFKLYALDAALNLAAGATKAELLAAMEGHILGQAELVGTYER
jgi:Raf kinase inhibitor-like YbhB/YbcL family protein